jgi:hypothetical protein
MRKLLSLFSLMILLHTNVWAQKCLSGDCVNGFGKYEYKNGDVYEGYSKGGYKNGKGKMAYANGDIMPTDNAHSTSKMVGNM